MLYSRAPRQLPPLALILDDLGNPTAQDLARLLGCSERTITRYRTTGQAPKAALLALFWETTWGLSHLYCEATNSAALHAALARARADEIAALKAQLAAVGRLGEFGSANDPAPGAAVGLVFARPELELTSPEVASRPIAA